MGLLKILWIDINLSGDNAVVIALATRGLPPGQQKKAALLRTVFNVAAVLPLALPY